MSTPEYEHWMALTVRRPDDVRGAVPLSWLAKKEGDHAERLMNTVLPADFPHEVDRGDALAVLALRESIRRDVESGRGNRVHEALRLGATWRQVAHALDITPEAARTVLRTYADGQRRLWLGNEEEGRTPLGFDAAQHAATLALCELADDESALEAVVTTP